MKLSYTVVIGSSRSMTELEDESIHLIFMSPPYMAARDYGSTPDNIGNTVDDEYYSMMLDVINECYRVLIPGRRMFIVIQDLPDEPSSTNTTSVIRRKLIAYELAHHIIEKTKFELFCNIIWDKIGNIELFPLGSFPYPFNIPVKHNYEYVLGFIKPGRPTEKPDAETLRNSTLTLDDVKDIVFGMIHMPPEPVEGHPAPFPTKLAEMFIKAFSFMGETVLDPFVGSGTTMRAARNLKRSAVGYEIEPLYLPLIKKRALIGVRSIEHDVEFKVIRK